MKVCYPIHNHKIDATFCDPEYYKYVKGLGSGWQHTGLDLNVRGTSGDGDLKTPIYAVADGEIVFAGEGKKPWGNLVVQKITYPNGTVRWVRYAHVFDYGVQRGQKVRCGEQIARMGKGAGAFVSHLHFDIFKVCPQNWSIYTERYDADASYTKAMYVDPAEFFKLWKAISPLEVESG